MVIKFPNVSKRTGKCKNTGRERGNRAVTERDLMEKDLMGAAKVRIRAVVKVSTIIPRAVAREKEHICLKTNTITTGAEVETVETIGAEAETVEMAAVTAEMGLGLLV